MADPRPFSKFEPDRPAAPPAEARDATALRRSRLLKWGWRIAWLYTMFGFAVILWVVMGKR